MRCVDPPGWGSWEIAPVRVGRCPHVKDPLYGTGTAEAEQISKEAGNVDCSSQMVATQDWQG